MSDYKLSEEQINKTLSEMPRIRQNTYGFIDEKGRNVLVQETIISTYLYPKFLESIEYKKFEKKE